MSWLLFMDESGHDHKQMPYEVRGGIALQDRRVWPFILAIASLEGNCFGVRLADFSKEFKGSKLLDKDRIKWAEQGPDRAMKNASEMHERFFPRVCRRNRKAAPSLPATAEACLEMTQGIFRLLRDHDAKLFASLIPRGVKPPTTFEATEYLRRITFSFWKGFITSCERRRSKV